MTGRADGDHRGDGLRHGRIDNGLHLTGLPVDELKPGAHLHLTAHAHFAFVAWRHKLGADQRHQQEAGPQERQSDHNGGRPVRERLAQQVLIAVGETVERRFRKPKNAIDRHPAWQAPAFLGHEVRGQHRHQAKGDHQ